MTGVQTCALPIYDIYGLVLYTYNADGTDIIITNSYDYYNIENKLVLDINKVYDLNQIIDYFKHTTKIFNNSKHNENTVINIKMYAIPKMNNQIDIPSNNLRNWNSIEEAKNSNIITPEIIQKYRIWNNNGRASIRRPAPSRSEFPGPLGAAPLQRPGRPGEDRRARGARRR